MSEVNVGDACSQEKFQSGDPSRLIRKRTVLNLDNNGKTLTKSPSDTLVEVKSCEKLVDKDSGISMSETISPDDGCIPPRTVKANHRLTLEGVPAFEFGACQPLEPSWIVRGRERGSGKTSTFEL
ncbi:uncharacterized protein LOC118411153 isoform X2 [Branchiostoma floridae]|uniref:Uncharacterized protein LOC118411153 isoform X2 n=1 Tax=Branchiostoma floridae TaxID=7739 RepID=A0A9J7MJ31_BRAFL|nr:uncharacterized protein LOC118411153 isoform X2 [Branchiostoma floridae]